MFRRFLSVIRSFMGRKPLLPALAVTLLAAAPLQAQTRTPYEDAGVFPGQVITNEVDLSERGIPSGSAATSLTVGRLPVTGTLRAFEPDYGFGGTPETWRFSGSSYAPGGSVSGPFTPLAHPQDHSNLTGGRTVDPVPSLPIIETERIRHGVPIFFILEDAGLNLRSDRPDTVAITVHDLVTGDEEVLLLTETGNNTGAFTAWIETQRIPPVNADGVLSTTGYSQIDAWYTDIDDVRNTLRTEVAVGPVDPFGIVFDSATGDPIDGIPVTLIDVATGQPAAVLGDDMVAAYPATVTTGGTVTDSSGRSYDLSAGEFRFPYVMPGTYRLVLDLPDGHDAPSVATDAHLEALPGDYLITTGSRLENFEIEPGPAIRMDVPVDRNREGGVLRDASIDIAEIGDFFEYEVEITVPDTGIIDITDSLPPGIRYVPGTLVIDGVRVDPVVSEDGRILVIGGFDTRPGALIRMTYTAQVQPGASTSALYPSNTVVFETGTGRLRLQGDHELRVKDAFDMEDVVILGQVVAGSCDRRDAGRDMSGIRVLLETGDYAITDEEGKFHFRDIPHRPRVVQVDTVTLPPHGKPVLCHNDTRSAGSPISRFVDVRPGMMGRVEFYVEFDRAAEEEDLAAATAEADFVPTDPAAIYTQEWLDRQGAVTAPRILTPANGMLPISDVADVLVLRPSGAKVRVLLDGEEIEAIHRDMPIVNEIHKTFIERFTNIRLEKGDNRFEVIVTDAEDKVLLQESRSVLNSTDIAATELVASGSILESDGRTTPVITLRLTGREGIPVRPGTLVQVAIDEPFAFMPDVRRRSEDAASRRPVKSLTTMVRDDGMIRLTLAPALETWSATLRIQNGDEVLTHRVRISAAERPWVLVGLAEGTVAERTIRENMRRSGDIGNALSGRVSLFAEGVIRGEWLLTMRYDTARDGTGEFDGIDPDQDYVVYGDRSWQDDAAKSRFPLYLRLRKEGAEFLVGDFDASIDTNLVSLNRQMTGVRTVLEDEKWRVMAFAAETSQRYVEDRIALDGTMGPYELSRSDILRHSENVRLVEVSRIDNSREISSRMLEPGRDYIISAGRIHLREPMPAWSADLNRHVLVVEYETDEEVQDGLMAGIRAEVQVSERVRAGATVIQAKNVDGEAVKVTLIGGDIAFQVNEDLKLTAEAIEVRKKFSDRVTHGRQAELRAEFDDGINLAEAYVRTTRGNVGINAESDDVRTDTAGALFSLRLKEHAGEEGKPEERHGIFAEGEIMAERDRLADSRRHEAELMLVNRNSAYEYGAGVIERSRRDASGRERELHLASRAEWSTPDDRITWGLGLEYALESENVSARDMLQASMEIRATEALTLFTTWEGEMRRSDDSTAGILSFGAEYAFGEEGLVRLGAANAFNRADGSGQALFFGVDNGIKLSDATLFSFGMDAHKDLGAKDIPFGTTTTDNPLIDETFVTLRGGLRHTRETWSTGVDVEHRWADSGDRGNIRFSADGEIDDKWSVGGDLTIGRSTEDVDDRSQFDIRLSAAHRGDDRDPITLLMLESSLDEADGLKNRKILGSVYHSRYLDEKSSLNLRLAARNQNFTGSSGITTSGTTTFLGAEYRHDLTDKLDFGLHGSIMSGGPTRAQSYGLSLGVTPFDNAWISIGYNFDGFRDDDYSVNGATDKGAFIQMRLKFDQDTIKNMFR